MKINGKTFVPPPLPLRPRTPAQKLAASNAREPHHAHLGAWLNNVIHSYPKDSDTTELDADEVLCSVHMRYKKVRPERPDDGTIFEGPDLYHLFLSVDTPSNARIAAVYNTSPYMMLGHWTGSSGDGDAPLWTQLTPDHVYRFRERRGFMARFVCGLTDIWVADVVSQTISPRMMNWAVANAVGTPSVSVVKYQRRRLITKLKGDAAAAQALRDAQFPLRKGTHWQRGKRLRARK
ncbi:hypothetical protein B0H16DRAFT_1551701 [Mycena metata]|uniref:Uncharacterized protein n=1 Tax=Mycena metata TaxID=1033252 RepID=A0AAD7IRS9_9AGAR|nr:hypothetical protein B0H16DRAFT_1551701 [Mycena metata]